MGLSKAEQNPAGVRRLGAWLVPLVIAILTLVLGIGGDEARSALQYDRTLVDAGELFRLVSAHFVHLGPSHALLNMLGLLFVWYLVGMAYSTWQWIVVFVVTIVAIDLGFWYLLPGLGWYVGLSGVLHGMLAAGIPGIWKKRRSEAAVLGLVVAAKLAYEAFAGPMPGSAGVAGGEVIAEAHLFGAIGGLLAGLGCSIRVRATAPI